MTKLSIPAIPLPQGAKVSQLTACQSFPIGDPSLHVLWLRHGRGAEEVQMIRHEDVTPYPVLPSLRPHVQQRVVNPLVCQQIPATICADRDEEDHGLIMAAHIGQVRWSASFRPRGRRGRRPSLRPRGRRGRRPSLVVASARTHVTPVFPPLPGSSRSRSASGRLCGWGSRR